MPTNVTSRRRPDPAIWLLSDQTLFRQGVNALLHHYGFRHVAEFASGKKLRAAASTVAPDIVVVDLDHERDDTMALVRALRRDVPTAHLVAIGSPLRQAAADSVIDGNLDTPAADRADLAAAASRRRRARSVDLIRELRRWHHVTPRQRDVMRWLAVGLDNHAIACRLRVGERAVKTHITRLLDQFHLANRTQLALLADHAGLKPPGEARAAS